MDGDESTVELHVNPDTRIMSYPARFVNGEATFCAIGLDVLSLTNDTHNELVIEVLVRPLKGIGRRLLYTLTPHSFGYARLATSKGDAVVVINNSQTPQLIAHVGVGRDWMTFLIPVDITTLGDT